MTARELLRAIADGLDAGVTVLRRSGRASAAADEAEYNAAALRALATRLDTEMAAAQLKTNESIRAENAGALATWHMISSTLARLDAPLLPEPR